MSLEGKFTINQMVIDLCIKETKFGSKLFWFRSNKKGIDRKKL